MTVTRTGPGVERLLVALKDLDGVQGKVGWFESARYPNGTPVAAVAAFHEFGTVKMPARPMLRPTLAREEGKWRNQLADGAASVLRGERTARNALEVVMLGAAHDVGVTIQGITAPALSPKTVKRKGFTKPLIDTGQMFQSVTGVVEDE